MNQNFPTWWIIAIAVVYLIRLALVPQMGLMPQDAYYYFYSEHLALSYFDHPPMIAYLLGSFTAIFGKSAAVIKLANTTLTFASLFLFYQLGPYFLNPRQTKIATGLYASTLLVSILSLNSTPDVPLMFCWTLTLWCLCRAVFDNRSWFYLWSGLAMGLAFSSKYTAVFLLAGFIGFLLFSAAHRSKLWSWRMPPLFLGILLGAAPVLIWNYQNDWASFLFQSADRADRIMEFRLRPKFFFGNIATQLLLLLPPLFIGLWYALFREGKSLVQSWKLPDERTLFLWAFSVPVIGFFTAVSLLYWVKLNWMMPAYVAGIILTTRYFSERFVGWQIGFAVVLHLILFIQIVYYPIPVNSDDTWLGWEEFADAVDAHHENYPAAFIFSDDDYKTAAILDFYLDAPIYSGNVIGHPGKQFSVVYPDLYPLTGGEALFVDSDSRLRDTLYNPKPPIELPDYFTTIEQLPPILIRDKHGKLLRKFWIYHCTGYRPEYGDGVHGD